MNPGTLRTPMHLGVDWAGLLRVTPTNPQSRPDKCSSTDLGMSQPDNHKTEGLPGSFFGLKPEGKKERVRERERVRATRTSLSLGVDLAGLLRVLS